MGDIWGSIVAAMASVIKFFAALGGENTAIGIILFTIAVRTLLLPLTLKSVRSSRAMQQLQPLIKEINKRYETKAGTRLSSEKTAAKQAEIMALYKEYSVNPAAGCLPILIQMPIFFAVYGAVSTVVTKVDPLMSFVQNGWDNFSPLAQEQSRQAFLSNKGILWITDLTKPDPTYILPVLMVLFQFMTTRMNIPRGGGADEQQRRMNGIMQWTPLIFGFTALQFPVGPVIYWVTTSLFSTIQQYFITGWGSLADLPGLAFLPQKKLRTIQLKKRDPNAPPAKPTLMERLTQNSQRIQAERTVRPDGTSAADASVEPGAETVNEIPPNNFGRKSSFTKGGSSGTSGEGNSPERNIQSAYNQLNSRPPKKTGNANVPSRPKPNPNLNNGNRKKK